MKINPLGKNLYLPFYNGPRKLAERSDTLSDEINIEDPVSRLCGIVSKHKSYGGIDS